MKQFILKKILKLNQIHILSKKKKIKVFNQKEVTITKQDAKTLLNKGTILITGLTNKAGKKYKANFKLEINDKYVNLSLDSFVN